MLTRRPLSTIGVLFALLAAAFLASPVRAQLTPSAPAQTPPVERPTTLDRAADERELRSIREEIERTRDKARDLRGRESGILKALDGIDHEIGLQDRLLRTLARKRDGIVQEIEDARADFEVASVELGRRDGLLRQRLRSMYELGKYHEYEILLGSTSFVDLVRRYDFLLKTAMRDREMLERHVRQKQEVERRAVGLRRAAEEIADVEDETEREKRRLLSKRGERSKILSEVRTERRSRETALAELEESSARLQSLLGNLEEERAVSRARGARSAKGASGDSTLADSDASSHAGQLSWPAEGPLVARFGRHVNPEFGTETFNNGIDIGAPAGADIRSVARGRVEYVSTLPGYGNCVIVNHGDGLYTLYAHASEVLVQQGDHVEEGQVIARVGSTGSLSGDLLHFEVREGRKPVDPMKWLRRRHS